MGQKTANEFLKALSASKPKPQAYDTEAQVVRVEGNTAWVHIPGGVDETPVAMTVNASEGDTVRVRVANGTAWLVGNDTAPPTDDTLAKQALKTIEADFANIGTAIINTLKANGINANWINAGAIVIKDEDGNIILKIDATNKTFSWSLPRSEMYENGSIVLYDSSQWGDVSSISIESKDFSNLGYTNIKSSKINMWDASGTVNASLEPTGIYLGGGNYGTILSVSPSAGSGPSHCVINGQNLEYWIANTNADDDTLTFSGSSSYYGNPTVWEVYATRSINAVQLSINVNINVKDAGNTEHVFTTLPEAYRPNRDVTKVLTAQSGNLVVLTVRQNGNVGMLNISGSAFTSRFRDSIVWIV